MISPFSTALAIARRDLDAARIELSEQREHCACLQAKAATLRAVGATERRLEVNGLEAVRSAYFEHSRRELSKVQAQLEQATGRLNELQERAIEQFSRIKAIQQADEQWRAERQRIIAAREQAAADDRAGSLFALAAAGASR